jgi:hypothetical protein
VTSLYAAALAAELVAAVAAVALARKRLEHRPAAVALVLLALCAVGRFGTVAGLHGLPRPVEGASRVLVYLDGALQLATSAVVAGLAVAVTAEKPRHAAGAVLVGWALASLAMAVAYPSPCVRGDGLRHIYLAADLTGLFIALVAIVRWARLRRSPGSAQAIAMGLVLLDLGILLVPFGPWRGSIFAGSYEVIQIGIVVFFAAFAAAQGVAWKVYSR